MTARGAYTLLPHGSMRYTGSASEVEGQVRAAIWYLATYSQPHRQRCRFISVTLVLILFAIAITTAASPKTVHVLKGYSGILKGYSGLGEASPDSLDSSYLNHLASPLSGYQFSDIGNTVSYIVGEHHAVQANYPDDYEWIDPYSRKPFVNLIRKNGNCNNAIGRMPAGSPYDALVVARGLSNKYKDPRETVQMVNITIVGFFANYNAATQEWERAGPEPYVLELPVWRQFPRPCRTQVNGGHADPRFMWSDAGEPLAIIGTSTRVPGQCKAIGMVDLRAVWPGLKSHLENIGYGAIPIKFGNFTEVGKEGKTVKFQKNWAPFFAGPKPAEGRSRWFSQPLHSTQLQLPEPTWPFFSSQVVPRTILAVNTSLNTSQRSPDSYVMATKIDLSMHANDTIVNASSSCILDSLPRKWDKHRFHQATPFYRVTMCPRGTCVPSRRNTVLLGLIHYKMDRKKYRRMFVTMSPDAPFRIISVSPPLHFGSAEYDNHVVFSVSLAFFPAKIAAAGNVLEGDESPFMKSMDTPGGYLNHGWLDDILVVGAGLRDQSYDSIHLPVATALRGHTLCPM